MSPESVLTCDVWRARVHTCAFACLQGAQPNDRDYRIFSAGMDNTVRLWDPYDMACVRVHDEAHSEITAMTFYEAWNILVTGEREWGPGGQRGGPAASSGVGTARGRVARVDKLQGPP